MRAGTLRELVRFERRSKDDNGDRLGPWEHDPALVQPAAFTWLRGGETVLASRLEGVQPVVIRVRSCAATCEVTADYRVVDLRNARAAFNIRSIAPDPHGVFIDFTCDTGGADG